MGAGRTCGQARPSTSGILEHSTLMCMHLVAMNTARCVLSRTRSEERGAPHVYAADQPRLTAPVNTRR